MPNGSTMSRPQATRRGRGTAVAILAICIAATAWAQTPDPKQVLANLGFPADAHAKVMAGELLSAKVASSNERELATGLAFLVKEAPKQFLAETMEGLLEHVDENTLSYGEIRAGGGDTDFVDLKLGDEVEAYRNAAPGDDLNLSSAEIEAFRALSGKPSTAVEAAE